MPHKTPTEESSRAEAARRLRAKTNFSILDCIKALSESRDDEDRAIEWLRKRMLNR